MSLDKEHENISREPSGFNKKPSIDDLYKALDNGYDEHIAMELGFALDKAGEEFDAIRHYLSALSGSLLPEEKIHVYFCLASSYRNTNQSNKAKKLINKAIKEFPDESFFPIMKSLINLDEKRVDLAVHTLITVVYKHVKEENLAPYVWLLKKEAIRQRHALKKNSILCRALID
jgi:tetratricopeptide (TPR) repeat protein